MTDAKKPREGYLELLVEGTDSDGNAFMQCDLYYEKRNDTDVHIIEKAAYDKLLVRIEKLREGLSEIENEHPDCMCDSYDFESWVICPKCLSLKILKQDDEAKK